MIDLRGKRILFTGRLRSFRRFQAQQLATILGAKTVNGIDKNVDILVVGIISKPYDQLLTTQKLTYARTYGIPKIDELAFISWCQWRLDQLKATL
ncbi:BRCT domain-containing protein [Lacticaseibacillus paracasei]|uniref:BRCT domain-containing protein n=2 Tax=Lacticaseibacillus paracasei TaxID=1597 RepID=UPI001064B303|nr:BRCT domain-containing protein [Lacticaseibacillus paracasei]TEA86969.1 cytosolic protein [Lacticaseibacillus paracasei]